jgi:hypothetical protein
MKLTTSPVTPITITTRRPTSFLRIAPDVIGYYTVALLLQPEAKVHLVNAVLVDMDFKFPIIRLYVKWN